MPSPVFAVDPGPSKSAYVVWDGAAIRECGILDNHAMLDMLRDRCGAGDALAVEMIASYGMAVGRDVFETCVWIGRFIQACGAGTVERVYRKSVKMHLCGSMRAKDSNIRQAIIDKFPAAGGGKIPQIGTSKAPGPLYGVSKDIWAALGVALTYCDQ